MHNKFCLAALKAYSIAWRAAQPILRKNRRLSEGWNERLVGPGWFGADSGAQDNSSACIWIHGASGGECRLVESLLRELQTMPDFRPHLLLTACTRQGVDVLHQAVDSLKEELSVTVRYFPLDSPEIMDRALELVRPRLIVLLETELWPGLLFCAAQRSIPVLVLNARMTPGSARSYSLVPKTFVELIAPRKVLAVSEQDAARFTELFRPEKTDVERMLNIKFDYIAPLTSSAALQEHLPDIPDSPIILLASTRKEEEPAVAGTIELLRKNMPNARVVVAPRHMHRAKPLYKQLASPRVAPVFASTLAPGEHVRPGSTVVWDRFGDLNALYGLAQSVFVGGSLAPLGGQNFLEPMAQGVVPCVGPSLFNFEWTGPEVFSMKLARKVAGPEELAEALVENAANPEKREDVRERFGQYISGKRGGTRRAIEAMRDFLREKEN